MKPVKPLPAQRTPNPPSSPKKINKTSRYISLPHHLQTLNSSPTSLPHHPPVLNTLSVSNTHCGFSLLQETSYLFGGGGHLICFLTLAQRYTTHHHQTNTPCSKVPTKARTAVLLLPTRCPFGINEQKPCNQVAASACRNQPTPGFFVLFES